jgi:hypothetical protein
MHKLQIAGELKATLQYAEESGIDLVTFFTALSSAPTTTASTATSKLLITRSHFRGMLGGLATALKVRKTFVNVVSM